MSRLLSALNWYQKKIGAYDKQLWEKTVDQRISRGVCAVPKKIARIKTELIDVDLVRGSAFPKAKPQHSWIAATLSGVMRILLLPFYFTWWKLQTNSLVSCTLVFLYILQIISIYLFYSAPETDFADVPTSEALMPMAMLLILGILHSQIVATFSSKTSHKHVARAKRKRMRRKFRTRTSVEYDTKSSPETASEGKTNSYNCSHSSEIVDRNGDCHNYSEHNRLFKSTAQRSFDMDLTDEESGLEVTEYVPAVDKHLKLKRCDLCSVIGCVDSSFVSYHGSNKQLNFTHEHIKIENHLNKEDVENSSSDEEYFVAKNRLRNTDDQERYILKLKHDPNVEKHSCFKKSRVETYAHSISRPSPNEIVDSFAIHDHIRKQSTKDSLSNYSDSCQHTELKSIIKVKKVPSSLNCLPCTRRLSNSYSHRHQHSPCKEGCYSSGDSGPDSASPNTTFRLQASDIEWPLITNSDCLSDSSDTTSQSSHADESDASPYENPFAWEIQETIAPSFNAGCPSSDKVSCTIWERNECKKVDLSVLDISSAIIRKVDSSAYSTEYLAMGLLFATLIGFLPLLFRLQSGASIDNIQDVTLDVINFTVPSTDYVMQVWQDIASMMIGSEWRVKSVVLIAMAERFTLSIAYFFLLSVAEKTFKQRFLYAKHFSYLTSSRRARRTDLPHFRLNKVRNIKTWLSVRSYLKKLGPQRSVDVTVSMTFILEVCVLSLLCVQLLKETGQFASKLQSWETLFWTLALGFYLLRFMIIGSKINKKYRNLSVLITEQINLYLHMEQKPHKKEELMLANSVLKLAADLLKELESPFKISGLCANPYLYNITKVVVLSAFSAVLTEVLGFKLKLYKIKMH